MEKSEELPSFLKVAKSCLGANGSKAVLYCEFLKAYKRDSGGKEFEKEAKNAGYLNGRSALAQHPTIFQFTGNEIRRIDIKDISHITTAVDQSQNRAMQNKLAKRSWTQQPFSSSRSNFQGVGNYLNRIVESASSYNKGLESYNASFASTMGPWKSTPNQYFAPTVPTERSVIPPRAKTPLEIRPAPEKFIEPKRPVQNLCPLPTKVIEPQQTIQKIQAVQAIRSLAAKVIGPQKSIEKDNVLVFDVDLNSVIKAMTEKITNLFTDVFNYGNEDVLQADLIETLIEKHGFKEKMDVQQFAALVTFLTEWEATIDGSQVIFKDTGKLDILPIIDQYNSRMFIPQSFIENGALKTGTILGNTEKRELVIRLTERAEIYPEFQRKLSNYYDNFDESSKSYLARHFSELFIGDLTLYWDLENERFLRCIVTGVENSQDVVIYSIDEGFTERTSPSKLLPIPYKFRKYEPFSLIFDTRATDLKKFDEVEKKIYLTAAEVYMNKGIVCQFKFLGSEEHPFIQKLFYGTWAQIID